MVTPLMDDISAAAAEAGLQLIANWLPPDRHAEMRETLYDVVVSALFAFKDAGVWREPPGPSKN